MGEGNPGPKDPRNRFDNNGKHAKGNLGSTLGDCWTGWGDTSTDTTSKHSGSTYIQERKQNCRFPS